MRLYDGRKCQSILYELFFFIPRFNLLLYDSHFSFFGVLIWTMIKQCYDPDKIFYFGTKFDLLLYDCICLTLAFHGHHTKKSLQKQSSLTPDLIFHCTKDLLWDINYTKINKCFYIFFMLWHT